MPHSLTFQPHPPGRPAGRTSGAGRPALSLRVSCLRLALLVPLLLSTACASILRAPLPEAQLEQARVLGRDDLRFWGDTAEMQEFPAFLRAGDADLEAQVGGIMHTRHDYLAISGGGADGAYGAGVLVGWSELGTRPPFTMVTGISTGSLTAPFAFLGSDYDAQLQLLYTTLDSSRIFFRRSFFSIVRGDAVADNKPLLAMLETYVNDAMIAKIAAEHRKGRRLFIGTTNLDAGRPVIWDIGRIANSGLPGAADLIRQVLLASTSIPGVFPPAYIKVEGADGRAYDEMHVDGGTSSQMFLYPARTNWRHILERLDVQGTPMAYVIRNSRVQPAYKPVNARLPSIAGRAVGSLIRTQGIGDAFRIAAVTQRDGVGLRLTWIPETAPADPGRELFDPAYMSQLFEFGRQRTVAGDTWKDIDLRLLYSPE